VKKEIVMTTNRTYP